MMLPFIGGRSTFVPLGPRPCGSVEVVDDDDDDSYVWSTESALLVHYHYHPRNHHSR